MFDLGNEEVQESKRKEFKGDLIERLRLMERESEPERATLPETPGRLRTETGSYHSSVDTPDLYSP